MNSTSDHIEQINGSILSMFSKTIGSVAYSLISICGNATRLIDKSSNVVIHGVSAAEHIARAGERRAEIYGQAIVDNGVLARREMAIRHARRLAAVEAEEAANPSVVYAGNHPGDGMAKPDLDSTTASEADEPTPSRTNGTGQSRGSNGRFKSQQN